MQKSIVPVQPNLDIMRQDGYQIQRPKNIENDHTYHLCISKFFFVTQCNMINNINTGQVSSLFEKQNYIQHFLRARTEGRFYENLVCMYNDKQPITCKLGYLILKNLLGNVMLLISNLKADQV